MGAGEVRPTSGCGGGGGSGLGRLLRPFFVVRSGPRREELAGLFEVVLLDEDLELGEAVDRERIDERRGPAADHGRDAVAGQEVLDQVRFEGTVDARDLNEVRAVFLGLAAVVIVGHARPPFLRAR